MESLDELMIRSAKQMEGLITQANADAVMHAEAFTLGQFNELVALKTADLKRRMEARYAPPRPTTQ